MITIFPWLKDFRPSQLHVLGRNWLSNSQRLQPRRMTAMAFLPWGIVGWVIPEGEKDSEWLSNPWGLWFPKWKRHSKGWVREKIANDSHLVNCNTQKVGRFQCILPIQVVFVVCNEADRRKSSSHWNWRQGINANGSGWLGLHQIWGVSVCKLSAVCPVLRGLVIWIFELVESVRRTQELSRAGHNVSEASACQSDQHERKQHEWKGEKQSGKPCSGCPGVLGLPWCLTFWPQVSSSPGLCSLWGLNTLEASGWGGEMLKKWPAGRLDFYWGSVNKRG